MKRYIAFLTSFVVAFSGFSAVPVSADEAADHEETVVITAESDADSEDYDIQTGSDEGNEVSPADGAVENVLSEDNALQTGDEHQTEDENKEVVEMPAFDREVTTDSVMVSVSASEGVFPADAILSVEKVSKKNEEAVEDIVAEVRSEDTEVAVSYTFDIKVLDSEGNEIQLEDDQSVTVSFSTSEVDDSNLETEVYHITDEGEAEKLETETEHDTVSVETDGFSLYTVEFTYHKLQYVLEGDTSIRLSEILEAIGLTGEATDVECSDETLFSASKKDGEYIVTAYQPFNTDEWMKVTVNGVVYTITVTDNVIGESDFLTSDNGDGTVTITGFTGSQSGNLNIPSTINGKTVTVIGDTAFYNCKGFSGSLTIPDSVITIGDAAFGGCSGFTGNLIIPDSVRSIGCWAFDSCGFTGTLKISDNISIIEDGTFWGCNGFTGKLVIPDNVEQIGDGVFNECTGFNGLSLGNKVASIGSSAFEGCKGMKGSLTIPDSVRTIKSQAFSGCSGFTGSLSLSNGIKSIENNIFNGCNGFTGNITIPQGVTSIGDGAFSQCSGFDGSLIIPDGVTYIGRSAFSDCRSLTGSLTIPDSVTTIGNFAFHNLLSLNGGLTIGKRVRNIGVRSFGSDHSLTGDLVLPDSLETIGEGAFESCHNLTGGLTIPDNVVTIGPSAFSGCGFTGSLIIGKKVRETGSLAFDALYGVKHIINQSNVKIKADYFLLNNNEYFYNESWDKYERGSRLGKGTYTKVKKGEEVAVTRVTISPASASVFVGKTKALSAAIKPSKATNKKLKWKSSNTKVATVDSKGNVKGVKAGKATITCTAVDGSKKKATCEVTVKTPVTKVKLNKKLASVKKGKTIKLKATVTPSNASNKKVKWKSSNNKIATVNSKGVVKGVKAGKVTITCTAADGSKKSATCKITVK